MCVCVNIQCMLPPPIYFFQGSVAVLSVVTIYSKPEQGHSRSPQEIQHIQHQSWRKTQCAHRLHFVWLKPRFCSVFKKHFFSFIWGTLVAVYLSTGHVERRAGEDRRPKTILFYHINMKHAIREFGVLSREEGKVVAAVMLHQVVSLVTEETAQRDLGSAVVWFCRFDL